MKAITEEDIDSKNQYRIKILPDPNSIREAASKTYIDNKFIDPSIKKKTAHVDFNYKNLDNFRFVKVNGPLAVREHLTPKLYVDESFCYWLDELSLLRLDPDEKSKLDERDSIVPISALTLPKLIIEMPTKSYVDSSHESRRNRRHLSSVFNDQGNEFDEKKITNLDSVTVDRDPSSDNELAKKGLSIMN